MTEKENNRFDETIRSILDGKTEEVPGYIWESVEKRLPRKAKRIIPLPLKIFISTAAAAAVVLAVLFSTGIQDDVRMREGMIAKVELPAVGTENEFPEILAGIPAPKPLDMERRVITDASTALAEEPGPEMTAPESVPTTTKPAENPKPATGKKDTPAADKKDSPEKDWDAIFAEDENRGKKGIRAAITLSGNAISNTNATRSSNADVAMAFRPSRNKELKDRVSESSSSSFGIPLSFGIGAKIFFTPRWALGVGISYTNLNRTFDGTYYQVTENQDYKTTVFSNIRNRQDYIGIPVNAYFNILQGDFINFYAYAGGAVEKCVSNRYLMSAETEQYLHKEAVKGVQFSVDLGIGLEFVIAKQFGLYIDPSLRYYFENSSQPTSIRTMQPLMFGVEMGLRVHL